MLKELKLKQVYSSEADNLIRDFYVPVLSTAKKYQRITGYFSSRAILAASQGMANFFMNGGQYQLIMGAQLTPEDYKTIKNTDLTLEKVLLEKLYFDPAHFITEIEVDYLRVFSQLLLSGSLEIKIAIVDKDNEGIFHEKVGILEDKAGDKISFSGSINETAAGWGANIEEFKVFRSWLPEEKPYQERDIERFNAYWNNESHLKALPLPEALKDKILKCSSAHEDVKHSLKKIQHYEEDLRPAPKTLYRYQEDAVASWVKNNYRGIFEMATGTGKTLTALGAIQKIYDFNKRYFCVVGVPQKHLVRQWRTDIEIQLPKAHILEAHSSAGEWREKIRDLVSDYEDNIVNEVVIIATHATMSSKDFIDIVDKSDLSLIADEMHNMGAAQTRKGLTNYYTYRIGLSATPLRAYDEEGTDFLEQYFSGAIFKYPLDQAIKDGWLTPYKYYPIYVELDSDETQEYVQLSKKITQASFIEGGGEYLERLLLIRSRIIKKCRNKTIAFEHLLERLVSEDGEINHLLVYCDQGQQLEDAQVIVNKKGIINHRFTQSESISDRKKILDLFDDGSYQCLLAIKCLDEGVNVPSTKQAIILASTTNPREYIQRRGRVLRKYPGKEFAIIYDFVVVPDSSTLDAETFKFERKIIAGELRRIKDFIESSDNKAEGLNSIYRITDKYQVYFE
ncbi:DEAD/DEAH box helicase family protein [Candidatus Saccharibacteria bacterium]|nr:DEAD/DEAH box helicase family protein [Candidatus Saccharibacteria bacterium]